MGVSARERGDGDGASDESRAGPRRRDLFTWSALALASTGTGRTVRGATPEPVFTEVRHVCIVVRDLWASVRRYYDEFGIGPWTVHRFSAENVEELAIRGEPAEFSVLVGSASIGELRWELIQPLDEHSVYAEFLRERGEGVQHIALGHRGYEDTLARCEQKGVTVLTSGRFPGRSVFSYLDTREALGVVVEIGKRIEGPGTLPNLVGTYP